MRTMQTLLADAALTSATLVAIGAAANELTVLSAGVVKPALSTLAVAWEARSGHRLTECRVTGPRDA